MKDEEDLKLATMFRSEAIADDGFTGRIVRRIRWRMRVRRFALPLAVLIGGAIAAEPALDLLMVASRLVIVIPADVGSLESLPLDFLPQLPLIAGGLVVAGLMATFLRLLER